MALQNGEFRERLRAMFRVEAEEHLQAAAANLLELEQATAPEKQTEHIEAIFRGTHTLKGAARSVDTREIEAVCQSLESIFAALKRGALALSPGLFDLLHESLDHITRIVASEQMEVLAADQPKHQALMARLHNALSATEPLARLVDTPAEAPAGALVAAEVEAPTSDPGRPPEAEPPPALPDQPLEERPFLAETVRIPVAKLDTLLLAAEELISAKLAAQEHVRAMRDILKSFAAWDAQWIKARGAVVAFQHSLKSNDQPSGSPPRQPSPGKKNGYGAKAGEFLDWNLEFMQALKQQVAAAAQAAEHDHRMLGQMVDSLLIDMKRAVMLPVSSVRGIYSKLVRDLARDQGKEVDLVLRGAEIEIDKRILEEMKDPIIHLVRNCVDHGLETPDARRRQSKPPRGTLTIAFEAKSSHQVELVIGDDGRGINLANVRAAAIRAGLISAAQADTLDEASTLALIFESGLSTSPILTDLSGRGLGLAIVREKVDRLGGTIAVETQPGAGATFRIQLPLTLATFRGVLVAVGEHPYLAPALSVERVLRFKADDIQTVKNRETLEINGQALGLVHLADVLGLPVPPAARGPFDWLKAVVLGAADKRLAFVVDDILGEQEVLVKSLGPQLSRVRNIASATLLGSGKVVPILHVPDLIKSATQPGLARRAGLVAEAEPEAQTHSILVAEDSVTARTLLKNILTSAGYEVATAVDGMDALTQLRTGQFDLVVSDVEMPRLTGLDLTAKIRADEKFRDLPVVLVTALESREDRERGIEVGANAYIVKSSLDHSNLLDVVRRLL